MQCAVHYSLGANGFHLSHAQTALLWIMSHWKLWGSSVIFQHHHQLQLTRLIKAFRRSWLIKWILWTTYGWVCHRRSSESQQNSLSQYIYVSPEIAGDATAAISEINRYETALGEKKCVFKITNKEYIQIYGKVDFVFNISSASSNFILSGIRKYWWEIYFSHSVSILFYWLSYLNCKTFTAKCTRSQFFFNFFFQSFEWEKKPVPGVWWLKVRRCVLKGNVCVRIFD